MSGKQRIERSTSAPSAHGPVKARKQVGELHGPADTSRQVRQVVLKVEQLEDGTWRFTSPRMPGWGAAARHAGEVTAVIRRSFTEAQAAAYSQWRGTAYDVSTVVPTEAPMYRRSRPRARSKRRCDVYDPAAWLLTDQSRQVQGRGDVPLWMSPSGHLYPESTQAVARVMAARESVGLSPRPDPVSPGGTVSMSAQRVESMQQRQGRAAS